MVQPDNPDLQLVQKAVKGSRKAFTTLFNRYFQAVYNYALTLAKDPAVAEDLTQEAFIRAHANLHRLGPPYNFRAWVFSLTRNYFIDTIRKEKRFSYPGFGTFTLKQRAPSKRRNPRTKEVMTIPARKAVTFKPAPRFKDLLK